MEALNQWLTSQTQLTTAASDFLDACTALKSVALQSLESRYHQETLETVLNKVQSRLALLDLAESQLGESRTALNVLLNSSTSRVPIHKLPSEILSSIFLMAASDPTMCYFDLSGGSYTLLDIQLVYVRWRQVATNTPSLWAHIDVSFEPRLKAANPSSFDCHTRMWLDRSCGVPVHLHFETEFKIQEAVISELMSILKPRTTLPQALSVSGTYTSRLVQALLDLYPSHGTPIMLKGLVLADIQVTHHENAFSWPINSLSGLRELELGDLRRFASPLLGELVMVLFNCPTLHTLRLRDLYIRADQTNNHPTILLPQLKLLELGILDYEPGMKQLLPLLSAGLCPLDVRLHLPSISSDLASDIQSLLTRCSVSCLTLGDFVPEYVGWFKSFLSSTPRLRALLLHISGFDSLDILEELLVPTEGSVEQLPHLQCLCLVSGSISLDGLSRVERVVSARNIRTLGFWSCDFSTVSGSEGNDSDDEDTENARWLQEIPPDAMERLSVRVQKVIVRSMIPNLVYEGVDLSIQEIIAYG